MFAPAGIFKKYFGTHQMHDSHTTFSRKPTRAQSFRAVEAYQNVDWVVPGHATPIRQFSASARPSGRLGRLRRALRLAIGSNVSVDAGSGGSGR